MYNKDLQISEYRCSCTNSKKKKYDSISKQKLKNEFCFENKVKILRNFYFKQKDLKKMKFLKVNKNYLNQSEKINFRIENSILARQIQPLKQIKDKKVIIKDLKCKIIGGGCGSSKFQIQNPSLIDINEKKGILDKKFLEYYSYFTDKKQIAENIEYKKQGAMQVDIIRSLKSSDSHIHRDVIIYKPKLMELIEVYLIYVLTGLSQNEVLTQKEIKELESLFKDMKDTFEIVSRDQPCCDLIFYFDILNKLNQARNVMDEHNKRQFNKAVEFMTTLVQFEAGTQMPHQENITKIFDLAEQGEKNQLSLQQQSKTNQIFTYLLNIWVRKKDKFSKQNLSNLTLFEEIQFYIETFLDQCSNSDCETDIVLLTMIKIDYYFSLALENEETFKKLKSQLSLNSEQIKKFIPKLIQKSNSKSFFDELQYLVKFTVSNHTYRFLSLNILLKYNKIIQNINDTSDYKDYIIVFLCYKYLSEKNKSVKLSFETNREFANIFNSNIEQQEFKDKIIKLSKERSEGIKSFLDLEGFEEKIENLNDIERLIANTVIEKWERDVKRRQQDNFAQKDDVLLEVKDLYIEQSITYLKGNKIIQLKQSLTEVNKKNQDHSRSNALQEILENFLQCSIQIKENQNISNTEEKNRCKILGILAEGGTGKSMLIKMLETYLISRANSDSEKVYHIPILIKCNSLNPIQPSIENYLLAQGVNQQQINSMKKSDRNKVILLDGYDEFAGQFFRVYSKLNLNEWKNTKVIVTSRREKLELIDASTYFSLNDDKGQIDDTSYCIAKLEEFTNENILEYYKMYFRQYRTIEQKFDEQQYNKDLDAMEDCMKTPSLQNLLYLPINLYLFTRMIVQVKNKIEIQKIKEKISDQIGIQEIFFNEQFKREAQDFVQQCSEPNKRDQNFYQIIVNSFFEYFQTISMKMFLNKENKNITNFLQIQKDQIQFKLSKQIENRLSEKEKNNLHEKIIHYVNSKIITRSKEEILLNKKNKAQNKSYVIEFKHKSLFEYFAARAMKYDFDVHGDNIYNLTIEQLKNFSINQKCIMNPGQNNQNSRY